jgi:excisionase family DNA binding protein
MANDDRFSTPPQVAKLLGVGVEKVKAFIDRGELVAVNLSMGSHRPRWRIAPEALQAFLKSRSNHPKPAPKPKRRSPLPVPAKEYV